MPPMDALLARGTSRLAYSHSRALSSFGAVPAREGKCRPRRHRGGLRMSYATSSTSHAPSGRGFGRDVDRPPPKVVHVPLVFVPGMKGSHLAFANDSPEARKKRAWLTLGNLLNFPPRLDDDPTRDLSLPLTYDHDPPEKGEDGHEYACHYPRQHGGKLAPDGTVDHIIEFNVGGDKTTDNFVDMNFLPFYGHAVSFSLAFALVVQKYNRDVFATHPRDVFCNFATPFPFSVAD
jgi:hypothetical protein